MHFSKFEWFTLNVSKKSDRLIPLERLNSLKLVNHCELRLSKRTNNLAWFMARRALACLALFELELIHTELVLHLLTNYLNRPIKPVHQHLLLTLFLSKGNTVVHPTTKMIEIIGKCRWVAYSFWWQQILLFPVFCVLWGLISCFWFFSFVFSIDWLQILRQVFSISQRNFRFSPN